MSRAYSHYRPPYLVAPCSPAPPILYNAPSIVIQRLSFIPLDLPHRGVCVKGASAAQNNVCSNQVFFLPPP